MSNLTQTTWTNWSGFHKANPQQILQPPQYSGIAVYCSGLSENTGGWGRTFIYPVGVYRCNFTIAGSHRGRNQSGCGTLPM